MLNSDGKVDFGLLKYNSNELFERLPLFDEAPLNYYLEDQTEPWSKLAKAIISPFSNFRFYMEIAKHKMRERYDSALPFYYPKKKKL